MKANIFKILVIIGLLFAFRSEAAMLYFTPSGGQYSLGQKFVLEVRLEPGEGEVINALEAKIHYPSPFLTATDIMVGESILTFIRPPQIDAERGEISFAGIIPGGYAGLIPGNPSLANVVIKIIFQTPGNVISDKDSLNLEVGFDPETKAYLNDAEASLAKLNLAKVQIVLNFKKEQNASFDPWLDILKNDQTPPEEFSPIITYFGNQYYLVFKTEDKNSGLDHYELINSEKPIENLKGQTGERVQSPYLLKETDLKRYLYLKAVDKAGNERWAMVNPSIAKVKASPFLKFFPFLIGGFILLVGLAILTILKLWSKK